MEERRPFVFAWRCISECISHRSCERKKTRHLRTRGSWRPASPVTWAVDAHANYLGVPEHAPASRAAAQLRAEITQQYGAETGTQPLSNFHSFFPS